MNGVEILAMEEVVTNSLFNWSVFWIAFGIIFSILFIIGIAISAASYDWSNVVIGLILGLIFGFISGAAFGRIESTPVEYETQYKVIISDEVSMNEFAENYKIISQEGKIYTVRER